MYTVEAHHGRRFRRRLIGSINVRAVAGDKAIDAAIRAGSSN